MKGLKYLTAGALLLCVSLCAWNYVTLQRPADRVIADDVRNSGIEIFTHYEWFITPSVLVFDLREVSGSNSTLDVTRVLFQFADKLQGSKFKSVILCYKGVPKFMLTGDYFNELGTEYRFQNPVYTLRTLPEHVYNLDGTPAFGSWSGGWLGVITKQLEDLSSFNRRWYLSDVQDE